MTEEIEALKFIANESLASYKEVASLQKAGDIESIDLDVEITKDRKLAIATKSIMTQIRCKQLTQKKQAGFNHVPIGQ